MTLKAGLYIVSTPIGNLNDITFRAVDILKSSDIILCEDTRVSKKLLVKHQINTTLSVYNDKSDERIRDIIIEKIESGSAVSLISDAGTPLISDPGYKLVRKLKEKGYFVDVIPGPSAPISALVLSGLPSNQFIFSGFLPKTTNSKEKVFQELENLDATLIFFDSASRIVDSLKKALAVLGDRKANIARELTKLFQESKTAKLSELISHYQASPPKGEIVLLISGKGKKENPISGEKLITKIKDLLNLKVSSKDITEHLYQKYHAFYSKTEIYKICNSLKDKK